MFKIVRLVISTRFILFVLFIASVWISGCSGSTEREKKSSMGNDHSQLTVSDILVNGQRQYHLRGCQKCHGSFGDGKGTRAGRYTPEQMPRDFRNLSAYRQGYQLEEIVFTLRNGIIDDSESIMPKYPFLTDEEIRHIAVYVVFLRTNQLSSKY